MLYRRQWYDMLKTSLLSIDWVTLSEYLLNIQQAPFAISNITPVCPLTLESRRSHIAKPRHKDGAWCEPI